MKFHFLRDYVDGGQIVIEFVETGRQLLDVFTKPLGRLRLMELKKMIGIEGVQGLAAGLGKELLSNLLLPLCERTAGTGGAEKGSLLLHCATAGAGAEWLSCHTVATAGASAEVSPAVTSSHCSSMSA